MILMISMRTSSISLTEMRSCYDSSPTSSVLLLKRKPRRVRCIRSLFRCKAVGNFTDTGNALLCPE
ncbi:hypothetical protein PENTCL1PPCAC_4835, partial [Pristionchus entomophagus]